MNTHWQLVGFYVSMPCSQKVCKNVQIQQHQHGTYLALIPLMNFNMGALTWNPFFFAQRWFSGEYLFIFLWNEDLEAEHIYSPKFGSVFTLHMATKNTAIAGVINLRVILKEIHGSQQTSHAIYRGFHSSFLSPNFHPDGSPWVAWKRSWTQLVDPWSTNWMTRKQQRTTWCI